MQRFRETLSIALIGLLPLHALLVTVGTKVIAGPGHSPLTYLALWKEGVLALILLIAVIEIVRKKSLVIGNWSLDVLDRLAIGLIALSVVVTAMTHGDWKLYLIGFKYDFIPLVAFVILRCVSWSEDFLPRVFKVLLMVAGGVAVYGIASLFLPQSWFIWLGYSDLHSLYNPDGPLAAFQQIGGSSIRRIQSTMSGPNQLGLWLLIPFSVALMRVKGVGRWALGVGAIVLLAMLLTFSRSAVLAAGVITVIFLWKLLPRKKFLQYLGGLLCMSFVCLFAIHTFAPSIVSRSVSTKGHIEKPIEAIKTIIANPIGLGLGTAGPASNRVSDTCVHLEVGSDASWASDRPDLCVFVGSDQVQPIDRECSCPVLPENWYLQIGVELGILGMFLYVLLIVMILQKLYGLKMENGKWKTKSSIFNLQSSIHLMFLGICIAALFLHAWEDAAAAYTLWILIAAVL